MLENNLFTKIFTVVILSVTILTLPVLSYITAYVNPEALNAFHYGFLIAILAEFIFMLIFRSKRFYLPTISLIIISIIWFILYTVSQGINVIVPSFSFVLIFSIISLVISIPYVIKLFRD